MVVLRLREWGYGLVEKSSGAIRGEPLNGRLQPTLQVKYYDLDSQRSRNRRPHRNRKSGVSRRGTDQPAGLDWTVMSEALLRGALSGSFSQLHRHVPTTSATTLLCTVMFLLDGMVKVFRYGIKISIDAT